jgi:hypothetical protein
LLESSLADKPGTTVERDARLRRHSRNRPDHLELAALVTGKCIGERAGRFGRLR